MNNAQEFTRWFEDISLADIDVVGTKNASIGDVIRNFVSTGIRVPQGFAVTTDAYAYHIEENALSPRIAALLNEYHDGKRSLHSTGSSIRRLILQADFPADLREAIIRAYLMLSRRYKTDEVDVAVRSSASPGVLPNGGYSGQEEAMLNVTGMLDVLDACKKCFASLYADGAIAERRRLGDHKVDIGLSVGIQKMIRSDLAGAGDVVTVDPETGFPGVVKIRAIWGLGQNLMREAVVPDEFLVFKRFAIDHKYCPILEKTLGEKALKTIYAGGMTSYTKSVETPKYQRRRFVLSDDEILTLARWSLQLEAHYGCAMDMAWAKDGRSGDLFVIHAHPERVHSNHNAAVLKTYRLHGRGPTLAEGLSVGTAVCAGKVKRIAAAHESDEFDDGAILVTEATDPDWIPVLRKAAGIVTDYGGKTSHTAAISREMGIPALVGVGEAAEALEDGQEVTLVCNDGATGQVLGGRLEFDSQEINLDDVPATKTEIMMNIAGPDAAFRWWKLPCDGVGLARVEFVIRELIKIHPLALIRLDEVGDKETVRLIKEITRDHKDPKQFFIDKLASGIAKIAASRYPKPVIVRLSDFTTSEYAALIGGRQFEIDEENPMLGLRGASRYYSPRYREAFGLECLALRKVRDEMGFRNIIVMIPYCRTVAEARQVLTVMADYGLERRRSGLQVYMMCEVPSNVILADQFAELFDGFSIGSNDLTQLVLGVDRGSGEMAYLFDERDEAVMRMIRALIERAHFHDRRVGICGQAPSDYPEFCRFLVESGIDSISLEPASIIEMKTQVAAAEADLNNIQPQIRLHQPAHA